MKARSTDSIVTASHEGFVELWLNPREPGAGDRVRGTAVARAGSDPGIRGAAGRRTAPAPVGDDGERRPGAAKSARGLQSRAPCAIFHDPNPSPDWRRRPAAAPG